MMGRIRAGLRSFCSIQWARPLSHPSLIWNSWCEWMLNPLKPYDETSNAIVMIVNLVQRGVRSTNMSDVVAQVLDAKVG
jgi:hypothetical protein